jgi:hypothetical protein
LKLPWRTKTEEDDPYWDFFINSQPEDTRNSLITILHEAPEGVVNPVKEDIHTPEVMSRHVKELSHYLGADLTGIARRDDETYPFAVVYAMHAEQDTRSAPGIGGQLPAQRALFVGFIVSAWIRELGYRGTLKEPVNNEELAAQAGLGSLNDQGRLVTPEFGDKVQVGDAILTDLPLQPDR